ncbi:uncharacterized protein ACLA_078480 [Aspergillus clavatus NRRL 1]|uniref:Kelch repeat protein n=1 Tax=Aspergillus clavatus (strain ATCC 1007 / CBS 513.65 / DSM 816 / NCTC 3887 / NRRL 1 / QM 1276 / 107) TaxID=344612 RepID=A1CLX0_ASPCL|nr:uncharacterized protein ACLA_078480 [Aspergillus clavatus NRRL 1]EAW09099.1 conserved hypothetical protein [Aspergillus clavatus NRRL 1]
MRLHWGTVAGFVAAVTCVAAQGSSVNVSLCNWDKVRVNTIRDTVYLDGGDMWWKRDYPDGRSISENNAFDTTTTNLTALFGNFSKANGAASNIAPNYRDGAMFANDNEFYLYGPSGLIRLTDDEDPPPANTVLGYERYQYGPEREAWIPGFHADNLNGGVTRYVTNGAGVSAPSENLGFYFSGMRNITWGPIVDDIADSANVTSHRMIKVDMSAMRDNKWSNLTLPSYVPPRVNAELVWIPVSTAGALIAIGGVDPAVIYSSTELTSAQQNASKRISPGFMETVSVYDVDSDKWYIQNTTGDIPPQLTKFCSVYASAADGSSHNIYIYGGFDGLSDASVPSDDVYVLSVPSFSWIKLYSGQSTHGRSGHKCVKPYPDQMLVLGGLHIEATRCLDGGIIQVLNLNTGRFQDTYDPKKWSDYKVPDLVTAVIGGEADGGATKTSPDAWTNSSLADVFATKYTKTIKTWYPYNTTTVESPIITPVPNTKGSSFPGWAGAIIGVLLGLALIAAGFLFWCLRRRRKFRESQSTSHESTRSWILRWMNTGGSTVGEPKPNDKTASTRYSGSAEEACTPSMARAVSPRSVEAGGEPVYEMHDDSTAPPVELPTPYNNNPFPSPVSSAGSQADYMSPMTASTPSEDGDASPRRPQHRRHVSSLSSVPSIANVMREDHRPSYRSDMSEASFESEGTGLGLRPVELTGTTVGEARLATTQEVDEKEGRRELP